MAEPFADLRQEIGNAELDSMPDLDGELDWAGMYAKDVKSLLEDNTSLRECAEVLVEDLENAHTDRTQLLGAVQFAIDSLPETSQNIRVRAKLEMALTDLVATDD